MTDHNPYGSNYSDLPLFAPPPPPPAPKPVVPVEKTRTRRQAESSRSKYKERSELILRRLARGPLSCFEAERLEVDGLAVHRAQAVICTMRERGHVIETVKINGQLCYQYRGKVERVQAGEYKDRYYTTRHWIETARKRKDMDAWSCRQCGSRSNLQTHHWRYNLFAESVESDLITLCQDCHEAIHEAASGSGMHFPRTITKQQAERINADQ